MTQAHYARIADLYDAFVRSDIDMPFWLNEAQQTNGEVLELMIGTCCVKPPFVNVDGRLNCTA